MMRYFVSDKTITLHDLANNGLLQLDQIRSYNPLSIFSTHLSDDNKNDQKKENEEDFLDEIDNTSSRRSSSRHNTDSNSVSKRLNDTSISSKQHLNALKSPRVLSKTSSDDYCRKSSLPIEPTDELKDKKTSSAKQQRRQTVIGAALSSRLSNPTTIKKNAKCKILFLF